MKRYTFEVGNKEAGERVDHYLVKHLKSPHYPYSRSFIQHLIDKEDVLLGGAPTKAHHRIRSGDVITVEISPVKVPEVLAEDIPLDIVYEDEDLLVVNKPAGMVVHPGAGNYQGTLVNVLMYHFAEARVSPVRGEVSSRVRGLEVPFWRQWIVHRLDKDTSGLLVVAKNDATLQGLRAQFRSRSIKRRYIALVKGMIQLDEGIIDIPVGRHPQDRQRMQADLSGKRRAITEYRVLKRFEDFTLVELRPRTGRTHQIRVHMAYLGHPILGDARYGSKEKIDRQALHATQLGFYHPTRGEYMEFLSKLPADIEKIIAEEKNLIT